MPKELDSLVVTKSWREHSSDVAICQAMSPENTFQSQVQSASRGTRGQNSDSRWGGIVVYCCAVYTAKQNDFVGDSGMICARLDERLPFQGGQGFRKIFLWMRLTVRHRQHNQGR